MMGFLRAFCLALLGLCCRFKKQGETVAENSSRPPNGTEDKNHPRGPVPPEHALLHEKDILSDRVTWSLFLKAALLVLGIWSASALGLYVFTEDYSKSGTFGDSFGVLNTLFSGLAFAGIIVSIKMQNDEMREQRKELQKQKKIAMLYHRERMFLLLMDEFKKSRERRFTGADVRAILRECLSCHAADDAATTVTALVAEVDSLLAAGTQETAKETALDCPLLQTLNRKIFRHERCEVFIKTFRQAADSVKRFDPASRGEYYNILCNSMSDAEEALVFLCYVARYGAQTVDNSQAMKLRESFDEIKAKL